MNTPAKIVLATVVAIALSFGSVLGAKLSTESASASEGQAQVPMCVCSEPVRLGITGEPAIFNCQCGTLQCVVASSRDTELSLACPK